jgi:hypothetical protein
VATSRRVVRDLDSIYGHGLLASNLSDTLAGENRASVERDKVGHMPDDSSAPIPATPSPPVDVESLVLAASREAVTKLAPEELEVFDSVATDWRRRVDRNDWSTPGGSVGFGIESALVTELVIQVAGAAIAEIFAFAATRARSRWRRWRGRKAVPSSGGTVPAGWSIDDVVRLRVATERHATALGLSAGQAGLLADALVGALRSSAGQAPTHGPPTAPPVGGPVAHDEIAQPVGDES